jgi:hypothetical protein
MCNASGVGCDMPSGTDWEVTMADTLSVDRYASRGGAEEDSHGRLHSMREA